MQSVSREFDLEPYAKAAETSRLSGRVLTAGFSTFLVVVTAVGLARSISSHSLLLIWAGVYILALLVASFGFRVALRMGPGATRLEIDPVGIRFVYRSGKVRSLFWSNRRFELRLRDYRPWTRNQNGMPVRASLFAWVPGEPRAALSPEAFDVILDAARSHGLAVTGKAVLLEAFEKRREITIRAPASFE